MTWHCGRFAFIGRPLYISLLANNSSSFKAFINTDLFFSSDSQLVMNKQLINSQFFFCNTNNSQFLINAIQCPQSPLKEKWINSAIKKLGLRSLFLGLFANILKCGTKIHGAFTVHLYMLSSWLKLSDTLKRICWFAS